MWHVKDRIRVNLINVPALCDEDVNKGFKKAFVLLLTRMVMAAIHLFLCPGIGSSFDVFLSDSLMKSPLHNQVT